jgi:hypothetical protein
VIDAKRADSSAQLMRFPMSGSTTTLLITLGAVGTLLTLGSASRTSLVRTTVQRAWLRVLGHESTGPLAKMGSNFPSLRFHSERYLRQFHHAMNTISIHGYGAVKDRHIIAPSWRNQSRAT